jgi:putative transposase
MAKVVQKAYRFRLEPTPAQRACFESWAGGCRFVWNWMLQQRSDHYKACGRGVSYGEQSAQLKPMKAQYPWLKEAPSQALQQTLRDLDRAFVNFFRRVQAGETPGYPKFRRKGLHDAFRFPQGFALAGNYLRLPKAGHVRLRLSRPVGGVIRNVTVSRRGGHWYASLQVEEMIDLPAAMGAPVGLDRGITDLVGLSNGEHMGGMDFTALWKRKQRLGRELSRRKRGGSNWQITLGKLRRIEERMANKRTDTLHKLTTTLSKNHAMVVVEKLRVRDMSKSAKGTVECPGSNVRQKAGLNRAILQQGWGELVRQLRYKLEWRGGELIEVDPAYTSQRCHACGHTEAANRRGKRFCCRKCGHTGDADINAAKNILAAGHAVSVRGAIGRISA